MITLDSVVRSYLGDMQKPTLHGYVPLLHYALEGFRELSYDVIAEVKTVEVKYNQIKVASLPNDFVKLIKVYAKVGDRVVEISEDSTISYHKESTIKANDTYSEKRHENRGAGGISLGYETDNELNGVSIGNYGFGHNHFGYFRMKKDSYPVEMHFSSEITSKKVFVEYLATPNTPGSETVLTPLAAKCLNEYIGYKESRAKNGEASNETQARKMSFEQERDKLFARESNLTLGTIADIYKQSYGEQQLR